MEIAFISWHWDFHRGGEHGRSRNLASAIKYARLNGVRYLFADTISLDQTLPPEDLIAQVLEFSVLYKTIPVVVACDQREGDLDLIMLRPCIFSEMRQFANNPTRVVYVGHSHQGACVKHSAFCCLFFGRPARSRKKRTRFATNLSRSRRSDFVTPVLHILNKTTSMAQIFDFKFIIPGFIEVFAMAETLPRNDYLLTVALLAGALEFGNNRAYFICNTFAKSCYLHYNIQSSTSERDVHSDEEAYDDVCVGTEYHVTDTILLQGKTIAVVEHYYTIYPVRGTSQLGPDMLACAIIERDLHVFRFQLLRVGQSWMLLLFMSKFEYA